tara:strand:- start:427 stop:612 length:186 start_codon:yes stop_codon:yes gene_type:complete
MTQQQMDQMNDSLQDQMLAAYYKQLERQYDEMVNEEPPFDDEIEEESIYYASNPYTTKGAK